MDFDINKANCATVTYSLDLLFNYEYSEFSSSLRGTMKLDFSKQSHNFKNVQINHLIADRKDGQEISYFYTFCGIGDYEQNEKMVRCAFEGYVNFSHKNMMITIYVPQPRTA